MESSNNSYV